MSCLIFNPFRLFVGSFLPEWLMQLEELNSSDKLVWAKLAQYAGENGKCFPKQDSIAKACGMSLRTVVKSIGKLEELKYIKITKPKGTDKWNHLGNRYEFICNKTIQNELTKAGLDFTSLCVKTAHEQSAKTAPRYIEENHIEENHKTGVSKSARTKPTTSNKVTTPTSKQSITFIEMFPKLYRSNEEFVSAWTNYLSSRKKPTPHAVELIIKDMRKYYSKDIEGIISVINKSIKNGWTGLFFENKSTSFNSDKEHQLQLALHPSTTKAKSTKYAHLKPDVICNNDKEV